MVDGILPFQNDLRNGNEGIAFLQQVFNDARQRFGSIFRSIVEQNDAARLNFGGYSFRNVGSGEILPVQAVTVGNGFKDRQSLLLHLSRVL